MVESVFGVGEGLNVLQDRIGGKLGETPAKAQMVT